MSGTQDLTRLMREKAEAVAATVVEVKDYAEALAYTLDICEKKEACQLLISGCDEKLSEKAEALCETKQQKIIAAPNLSDKEFTKLQKACEKQGILCIRDGLRKHLAGIDIGFTHANLAIADTGTCVVDSTSEELRIATMVSEINVMMLKKSTIRANSAEASKEVRELMGNNGPHYTAFITGPSRTADIERVLAIGVHGPLELHIIMLEA